VCVFSKCAKVHLKHIRREGRSCHTPGEDNVPDNLAVNSARDAVLQLEVHLGHGVLSEN
jgi:hypothetical protein